MRLASTRAYNSYTWFFRAIVVGNMVDSCPNTTLKALLDSRNDSREQWLPAAETISFSCSDLSGTGPLTFSVEGFVHGREKIGCCSLNKWLPMNHTDLKEIKFDAVYPGNGQLNPRYTKEPMIKTFLDKTTLEPVDSKCLRVDYHGSTAEPERPHHERAVSWFLRVTVRVKGGRNFQDVLADRKVRQETSLNAVSFITYAFSDISGQESEHPGTI